MNTSLQHSLSSLDDLLLDEAIEGLGPEQQAEVEHLRAQQSGPADNKFMQIAALTQVAFAQQHGHRERLPAALRALLLSAARSQPSSTSATPVIELDKARTTRNPAATKRAPLSLRDFGWAVAAMLAITLLMPRPDTELTEVTGISDHASARAVLLNAADDAVVLEWAGQNDLVYAAVSGDVVWSDTAQTGFMRLTGLPANNPDQAQYQLWIVDAERSAQPVDGGVFNVPAGAGEVVIPIDAKLAVRTPSAFAITLEKPGGVVVSAGPLLVVAAG